MADETPKPSMREWMRDNPGKGMNDYFSKFGQGTDLSALASPVQASPIITPAPQKSTKRIEWFTMLISAGMIASFFQPWIDGRLFELQDAIFFTGMEIPAAYANWEKPFILIPDKLLGHYIIPIAAAVALIASLLRWYWVKFLGAALSMVFVARWIWILIVMAGSEQFIELELDMWSLIQMGTYAAVACAGLYLVDFIKEWF